MNRIPAAVEMNVAEGPEAEGARRATGASGPSATLRASTPDPEVPAKVQRRQFTAAYRLRILKEADACTKHGALGALLRREGLYSSHLVNWRRQREPGKLARAETIITLQKNHPVRLSPHYLLDQKLSVRLRCDHPGGSGRLLFGDAVANPYKNMVRGGLAHLV